MYLEQESEISSAKTFGPEAIRVGQGVRPIKGGKNKQQFTVGLGMTNTVTNEAAAQAGLT